MSDDRDPFSPTKNAVDGKLSDDYDKLKARRDKAMGRRKEGCFGAILLFLIPPTITALTVLTIIRLV